MSQDRFFNAVATGNGHVSIMLYGPIGGDAGINPERIVSELAYLSQEYPNIDVHINSMGGEVFAGIAIYNALKECPSNVNIYVDGLAASIAGIIALCGKPLNMSRYSRLMLHSVSGSCKGGVEDMRKCADLIDGLESTLADMISKKCQMSPDYVKATYFDGKDHWFTAEEALQMRLCDNIYDIEGSNKLGAAPTNEQVYQFVNMLNTKPSNLHNMEFVDKIKGLDMFKDLTEAEIIAKVKKLSNDAAKAEGLEARVKSLEDELKQSKEASAEAFLDKAVSEGRIGAAQKEMYRKLMNSDEATTKDLINSLPKAVAQNSIKEFLGAGAAAGETKDLAKMSWEDIDKANLLGELKEKYPELYKVKFKEAFGSEPRQ